MIWTTLGLALSSVCTQWNPLHPIVHAPLAARLDAVYASPDFKQTAYHALSGAIRIPYVLCLPSPSLTFFAAQSQEMTAVPSARTPFGSRLLTCTTIYNRHSPACQSLPLTHAPCFMPQTDTTS